MRLPLAATTWSLAFLLVAWVPTCTQSCFCHLPPQSALDRKKGASTWEDSRVRAEVSWRNATEGRGLHHSPQSPSSVLPGTQPGECRGLSPRPATPELTRPPPHTHSCSQQHPGRSNPFSARRRGAGYCTQTVVFPKAVLVHALCRRGSERVNRMTLGNLS